MGTFDAFDDEQLSTWFGAATHARGLDYADDGRVMGVEVNAESPRLVMLHGRVRGSAGRAYETTVVLAPSATGGWLDTSCTCPVGRACKHAVALTIVARRQEQAPGAPGGEWRRRIGLLLDELDEATEASTTAKKPLALQVELPAPSPSRYQWRAGEQARGALRLRPLQRGARDTWVKSQVAWTDVAWLHLRKDVDPGQAAVLSELLSAYRSAQQRSYYGTESHLSLSGFGSTLWTLLAEARRVGLPLVPAGDLIEVAVLERPVSLGFDVHGADSGQAELGFGVAVDGRWYAGDQVEVLGPPVAGHGVALWDAVETAGHRRGTHRRWRVTLARLEKAAGAQTRRLLATAPRMSVPSDELGDLVSDYLPRLRRHLPVVSSDATVAVPELVEPRLVLAVTWKAADEAHLAWSWHYRVGEDDRIYALGDARGLRGVRRPAAEQALLDALELDDEQRHRLCAPGEAGPEAGTESDTRLVPEQVLRGYVVVPFVEDTLIPLERSGQVEIEELGARPDFRELTESPVIRFEPRHAADTPEARRGPTDWLDLEVVISVGDRFIGLASLVEALTLGAERIVLADGAHLRIDRPEFARLTELVRAAREMEEQPRDGVRVGKHDLGLWAELAEIGLVDAQAEAWVRAAQALRDLTGLPEVTADGVAAELRGYQEEGLRWLVLLWQLRLGGILADDMGLGKTLQALALMVHARAHGADPFLVVAPTSVVATWAHEARTFAPGLVVRTVTESASRRGAALAEVVAGADLVVTSYTLYRLEADAYVALSWGGLVLDEAQTIKNHLGKTYQAVRRLEVPFRLALTGTPLENRLLELWSLLSVVAPGLYPYPRQFTERVADPVEKEGDSAVLARFRQRIRPFLLRRTKELVATDLPPKQEQVLEVRLTPRHRTVYDTHLQRERQHVLGLLGDFDRQRMAIFRSLTRLRQLSLDAALVDPDYEGVGSAKIDVLVDHLVEIVEEGHRALVFSQFTSFLARIRSRLDAAGVASKYLDGRTRKRAEVIGGFKAGQGAVFLISLKAGGVGLTLTEADYVFVMDPWWNPAVEAQAVDRAHRIGQSRPVIVYRLVASDTIEEKVMALKERKAALFADVLDGEGGMATPLDADDVRRLFDG